MFNIARIVFCSALAICLPAMAGIDGMPADAVPVVTVPALDYVQLDAEDVVREHSGLPPRFALPTTTIITPGSHGLWERTSDERLRWRLRVSCENAMSMNLGFGRWTLPTSGSMTISTVRGDMAIRDFTADDNRSHGELWTPVVPGNDALITIEVDASQKRIVEDNVTLTSINAGYRWVHDLSRGSSESCNIDVMCSQADAWWDEIPSVGVYTLSGFLTCTGFMVNNTAEDQTPYFMTANHCGVTSSSDSSIVVYWNHQNSTCRTPGGGSSGGNGNGTWNQFTSGSTMRATRSYTDFTLTELSSDPNPAWGITFSGWSRASSASNGAGIHHPECAEKRISFPDSTNGSGEYWDVNWDEGRTAPGSSGSPLFDGNHRAIGQLCCGSSYCWNDYNDYYGRSFYLSWSYLDDWLDPIGSGATTLDTLVPGGGGGGDPVGACCVGSGGTCIEIPESNCNAGGGTFLGEGIECDSGGCDPTGDCPSDVTGDGVVDVSDILAAIAAWGSCSGCDADVDDSGTVDVSDILAIIGAWGPC